MSINTINNITSESQAMLQALINEAVEKAVKFIRNEDKNKSDKRLHNTYLLLKNYNNFKDSVSDAKYDGLDYTADELRELRDNAIDDYESGFIESILRTKKRTKIMINHIDDCLKLYKYKCQMSGREDIERRHDILKYLYIEKKEDGLNYTAQEVAEILYISTGTVSSTKKIATQELAILIFGIDALKFD
jgi:hypothetical protein